MVFPVKSRNHTPWRSLGLALPGSKIKDHKNALIGEGSANNGNLCGMGVSDYDVGPELVRTQNLHPFGNACSHVLIVSRDDS
jgi:hypothetical protein